ncbi:alpha/beta fold hydrolase [Albidovulum sediminicola]|uniref:Alpha/beta hydrolase n=1 Tax=Albidovulum sediminicola TaxID=2984331 RepID=A0ABT2Z1Y9_9RHOB|nr:alpha/beta hydrolase [Defluviimonas sp. WL0075]MCV2865157.1 alpha/beta hydrolase [Defluviimonas sp. WL0075]
MEPAPFFDDIARAPDGARALWATAQDGVRLRICAWAGGTKGTVLIFPGRTEYVEKYGLPVTRLTEAGYACLAIDWRGQGLSDRIIPDPMSGHVHEFVDYQSDVAALMTAARALELPEPMFLMGHSMGGCIGLRALHSGLPVRAAAFSAPMWGIRIHPVLRPTARFLSSAARTIRQGHRYAPGTSAAAYIADAPFEDNFLTRDPTMWDFARGQIAAHPELGLGGPSLHWLNEALAETRMLLARPAPDLPCYVGVGTRERIVDPIAIDTLMARWPGGQLDLFSGAEHELLMELPEVRERFLSRTIALFNEAGA